MQKLTGILKKDRIVEAAQHPRAPESCSAGGGDGRSRIVEQRDGLAVVEVTCECGKKILLQCEY